MRGTALHDILDRFIGAHPDALPDDAEARLAAVADEVLAEVPWPVAQRLWQARLARVAPWFVATEAERRAHASVWLREAEGRWTVNGLPRPLLLKAKADRIDRLPDGRVAIYDYKSGKPPTEKEERAFARQLWLEAAMAAEGAFGEAGPLETARIAYVGLGASPEIVARDPGPGDVAQVAAEFRRLMAHYLSAGTGFASRRAVRNVAWSGDYDQLARYGEWDETEPATVLPVGIGMEGVS
jgi:RecB family exonuclease